VRLSQVTETQDLETSPVQLVLANQKFCSDTKKIPKCINRVNNSYFAPAILFSNAFKQLLSKVNDKPSYLLSKIKLSLELYINKSPYLFLFDDDGFLDIFYLFVFIKLIKFTLFAYLRLEK